MSTAIPLLAIWAFTTCSRMDRGMKCEYGQTEYRGLVTPYLEGHGSETSSGETLI